MSMAHNCKGHGLDSGTGSCHLTGMTFTPSAIRPPRFHDQARQNLRAAGYGEAVSDALMALDIEQFHYVRRVIKGDLPQALIEELGAGLEVTQFHALSALVRLQCGQGRGGLGIATEATVGHLAEEMAVDPSRASRIAADLVERGYLRRAVSQQDGRRSVLELTEQANALFDAFHAAKWQHSLALFKGWSEQDILDFSRLFAAYAEGMRQEYPAKG